jgi:O-succinylbenzoic acid--CoA ligase
MATPLQQLQQRCATTGLAGIAPEDWLQLTQQQCQALATQPQRRLLVAEQPEMFLAEFLAACETGTPVFLANPRWGQQELSQAQALIQTGSKSLPQEQGWIGIPTGGSSGQLRFAVHTWKSLSAAVAGLSHWPPLAEEPLHSLCCLPLFHVSGLMQFLRALQTGGEFRLSSFRVLEQALQEGSLPCVLPGSLLSLVPTQLQRLLRLSAGASWLRQFRCIFLGGAPAWPRLLDQARELDLPLALTYGMTETAAMVTCLDPLDFLAGHQNSGQALPHVHLQAGGQGESAPIRIRTPSLALGYYQGSGSLEPLSQAQGWYRPDDIGWLDAQGRLEVVGRASDKILTGGESVWPAEVEAALRATGYVEDVAVLGWPDAEWGERVVAVVVAQQSLEDLKGAIAPLLAPYKRPKQWLQVQCLPRNAQGKLDRTRLQQLLQRCDTASDTV